MIKICDMTNVEFFKLSSGDIVFVGLVNPNVQYYLPQCKANLIIDNSKLQELSILGEDRLIRADRAEFEGKRLIRTRDNILEIPEDADVRLQFFE